MTQQHQQQQQQNQQHANQGEGSFSKGMKVTFGVIFALFLFFVVAPCAMCGGCGMFGAAMQEAGKSGVGTDTSNSGTSGQDEPTLEVTSVDTRVTEKNRVYWKYAWKTTISNNGSAPNSVDIKVKWLDADGFEVDSANEYDLRVPANGEETFDGSKMITLPSAKQVDRIEVEEL